MITPLENYKQRLLDFRQAKLASFFKLLFFFLVSINASCAREIVGPVIGIADGDTLFILDQKNKTRFTVRLTEIDAPERNQAFGKRSRQSLSQLCYRKIARIKSHGRDRYNRILGRVYCNGVDANAEQIRRGLAWAYSRYLDDSRLYVLQDEARNAKRGLWIDKDPVPPWRFRRQHKSH